MPTYEYECRSCHHRFEKLQSIRSKPAATCPRCKRKARRLISSGTSLLFKGSGFYITDYRSSDYKKRAEADRSPKSSSGDSTSSKKTGSH